MKFKYYHLHSGVNIEQLEKTLLTQIEEFKDKKSHGKITFQNKLKPAMIVDIKPEHKKYITWMFRGSRKQPRPIISFSKAKELGLIKYTNKVFSSVRCKDSKKMFIITSFTYLDPEHCPPKSSEEKKLFQDFWRNHALIKEHDAHSIIDPGPWWSMNEEDFQNFWNIINSKKSSKKEKEEARIALLGKDK